MAREYSDSQKMKLVEQFREDYLKKKMRTKIIAMLMIIMGISLLIIGINMAITGFSGLFDIDDGALGSYIGGILMAMGGFFLTIAGTITFFVSKQTNNAVSYVRKRFRKMHLEDPENFLNLVEDRKRVVKCEYCGHQVNPNAKMCSHCGAAR